MVSESKSSNMFPPWEQKESFYALFCIIVLIPISFSLIGFVALNITHHCKFSTNLTSQITWFFPKWTPLLCFIGTEHFPVWGFFTTESMLTLYPKRYLALIWFSKWLLAFDLVWTAVCLQNFPHGILRTWGGARMVPHVLLTYPQDMT